MSRKNIMPLSKKNSLKLVDYDKHICKKHHLIKYFRHVCSRLDKSTRNVKVLFLFVSSLYTFSLLTAGLLPIEAAGPPVQTLNEEELNKMEDIYFNLHVNPSGHCPQSMEDWRHLVDIVKTEEELDSIEPHPMKSYYRLVNDDNFSLVLSTFFSHFIQKISANPFHYEISESAFERRDHRFIARSVSYIRGLTNKTDAFFKFEEMNHEKKQFPYSLIVNNKRQNRMKSYGLNIALQTIEKEEHDSSVVLNNLRTIAAKDLQNNNLSTITKDNLLHRQHARITCGLSAAISFFSILKICKNRSLLNIVLGTLISSIIGLSLGKLYLLTKWKNPYDHAQPSNEEIDNKVISLLQPKLTCGVLRLEEEARVISEYLTGNANLPTWRERKIYILQQDHNLPKVIAELIVEFTP